MTHTLRRSSRIARRAVNQGARLVTEAQVAVEKSVTGTNLLKAKKDTIIGTMNVQTLQKDGKIPELIACAESTTHDIICIQEHRFLHEDVPTKEHQYGRWKLITCSGWKNSINASMGGNGILLSQRAYTALSSVEKISPRIMIATFNGNPKTTILCCYSPTNTSEITDAESFYLELSDITKQVPKHNVILVAGDLNSHLGHKEGFKFSSHMHTNRNGYLLKDYLQENNMLSLNTLYQKRPGQRWTHTSPNGIKSQLDFILINKKWKNTSRNCRAYNSFVSLASDHRIVSAKLCLSLRSNKIKSSKDSLYDWSCLKHNSEVRNEFVISTRNRFEALQQNEDSNTLDKTYNNFVLACKTTAGAILPKKMKLTSHKPWENEEIQNSRKILQQAGKKRDSQPSQQNKQNFSKALKSLKKTYLSEQTKYLQQKIDEIENSVANQKSSNAWKVINEISGRRSTNSAKLKASNQEERVKLWKKHFQDLLGKPPQTDEQTEIVNIAANELKIRKGPFQMDELSIAINSIKSGKACGLDGIPAEVWKLKDFQHILLDCCNGVYLQDTITAWTEGCLLPFPKKGDLSTAKNYRGITLTPIAAKIYNLLLLNRIRPEIDPILRKNQNGFRSNRSTSGQILTIRRVLEGIKQKNLPVTILFIDFSKAFDSIHREKMLKILLSYGIPTETVKAISMLYQNTRSMVRSPDGDTDFFDISAGVLQGDTLAPYIFIICLDYILRRSIDENVDLGFTLEPKKSRRYPEKKITDADYADDLAVFANLLKDASTLLHLIERTANTVGLHVNATKTEYICLNQDSATDIKSLNGSNIKKVEDFKYLGSYIASTERDIEVRLGQAWGALHKLDKIWKSNLSEKLKRNFFRATVESVLIYGSVSWTLTSTSEKKIDGAYTRMLRAALNIPWQSHTTNEELYEKMPRITQSIRQQRMRFVGHSFRSKEELAGDVLLWQPKHGKQSTGRPKKSYIDQLISDTGCSYQELPTAMGDRDEWRKRVMANRASST